MAARKKTASKKKAATPKPETTEPETTESDEGLDDFEQGRRSAFYQVSNAIAGSFGDPSRTLSDLRSFTERATFGALEEDEIMPLADIPESPPATFHPRQSKASTFLDRAAAAVASRVPMPNDDADEG